LIARCDVKWLEVILKKVEMVFPYRWRKTCIMTGKFKSGGSQDAAMIDFLNFDLRISNSKISMYLVGGFSALTFIIHLALVTWLEGAWDGIWFSHLMLVIACLFVSAILFRVRQSTREQSQASVWRFLAVSQLVVATGSLLRLFPEVDGDPAILGITSGGFYLFALVALCVAGLTGVALTRQVVTVREKLNLEQQLVAMTGQAKIQAWQLHEMNEALMFEIDSRSRVEEEMAHNCLHDPVTGLANRAFFLDRLQHAMAYAEGSETYRYAVLLLDLDVFKAANDYLGHALRDQLLVDIARRLQDQVRGGDLVARLGGDEFAILLEGLQDFDPVRKCANRILEAIKQPCEPGGQRIAMTASIGLVYGGHDYDQPEEILRDADIAMHQAKRQGRARSEVFNLEFRDQILQRIELENDLQGALERQELVLYYQPIHVLDTGDVSGFEALLRWQHPLRGMIYPVEFIAIAEESGLIIPIGRWVLENACRQLKAWQDMFPRSVPLTMNVNISSLQLVQPDFLDDVRQILEETALQGESLRLEITESICLQKQESLASVFAGLDRLGIELQIDDFGTGYSALSYLQNYPVRAIKIDREFINRMGDECRNGEIVRMIIGLAHGLGMGTVAEGIESQTQLAELREFGCLFGQGFHLSPPMAGERVYALLQ
jgi:diguanylate cyclase (GGDEF)-like protein